MSEKIRGKLVELEAAEALAALAHMSATTTTSKKRGKNEDFVGGEEFERSSQRIKISIDSSHAHITDQAEVLKQPSDSVASIIANSVRADHELIRIRNRGHGSAACSKSRQQFTEAEKEERRVRRVLANRESARQTIRRRQAMYEELTKNAADLAMENANLKTAKEQALKEYNALKSTNLRLKKVVELDQAEVEENLRHTYLTHTKASASSDIASNSCCTRPSSLVPIFWPSGHQYWDTVQLPCTCQKCTSESSQVHRKLVSHTVSEKEKDSMRSTGMGAPICVLPFPCFFPFPMHQYLHCGFTQNEACLHLLGTRSSSSKAEERRDSLPAKINLEVPHSTFSGREEGGFDFAPYGGNMTERVVLQATPSNCTGSLASCQPNHKLQEDDLGDSVTASPASWGGANGMTRQNEGPLGCPRKKLDSFMAAAEARRRRKELTKLKTLYYCRLQQRRGEGMN